MNTGDGAIRCSVIVPVFNEASALRSFIPELLGVMLSFPPGSWEILFVDDGSTDLSADILAAHLLPDSVILLRHPARLGSGAARKIGSARARGEWLVWIDGDGTYDPRDICTLWDNRADADQVIGCRDSEAGSWPILRALVKRTAAWLAGVCVGYPILDLNSGLRTVHRTYLGQWIDELPDGFSCTSTATLASISRRHRVRFVPIQYRPRHGGTCSKFHPIFDTIRLFRVILRYGLVRISA